MKHRKMILLFILALMMVASLSMNALAVDESEVESAIATSGEDAVAGNLFIWFLCAVSFLKISQKIDSFMTSLGINVGRTGGSMMAEMLIAGRALGGAVKATGGAIGNMFNRGITNNQATGQAFTGGGGGIIGVAKRAAGNAAASSATQTATGLGGVIGGAMLSSSMNNGGKFATNVVGAVATGNIAKVGSITGAKAAQALTSYLGYGAGENPVQGVGGAGDIATATKPTGSDITSGSEVPSGSVPISADIGGEDVITASGGATAAAAAYADEARTHMDVQSPSIPQQHPTFRDIEIGGGRITGFETPAGGGEERQFAMYNASQYMTPNGEYETVQTADGETWYKQYAQPTVEKTPYEEPGGKIKYNERIVDQMPQVPKRKDRI